MSIDAELRSAKGREECMAMWRRRVVVIERVFIGRGIRRNHVRAKIIDETKIHYVDYDELEPF